MEWFNSIINTLTNANNWSVDSILSAFSICLVIIGGLFAYKQWTSANKIRRTEFINQIISKLRFDKSTVDTMYKVDYDHEWYNEEFHNAGSEIEFNVDKLLAYLSYICYLYELKTISKKEFRILQYEVNRVCSSPSVQSYLWNLYHFSKAQGTECTFQYLINYGIKHKIINMDAFYSNQSTVYPRYLNF